MSHFALSSKKASTCVRHSGRAQALWPVLYMDIHVSNVGRDISSIGSAFCGLEDQNLFFLKLFSSPVEFLKYFRKGEINTPLQTGLLVSAQAHKEF